MIEKNEHKNKKNYSYNNTNANTNKKETWNQIQTLKPLLQYLRLLS